jgi:hypothetical protein
MAKFEGEAWRAKETAEAERAQPVSLPKERTHFKELLLANHFGTIAGTELKPKAAAHGNTTYEQLMCVGYQPEAKRLEAVVNIKQNGGYSGDICMFTEASDLGGWRVQRGVSTD